MTSELGLPWNDVFQISIFAKACRRCFNLPAKCEICLHFWFREIFCIIKFGGKPSGLPWAASSTPPLLHNLLPPPHNHETSHGLSQSCAPKRGERTERLCVINSQERERRGVHVRTKTPLLKVITNRRWQWCLQCTKEVKLKWEKLTGKTRYHAFSLPTSY